MKHAWLLILLLVPLAYGLSIDVATSPQNATSTQTIHCLVNATGTGALSADIQWFLNGGAYLGDTETLALTSGIQNSTGTDGDLEPADTSKGQTWICQASVDNGTATNVSNSTAITIENSQPIVLSPTSAQTAIEDQPFSTTATATDPDGDAIITWISSDLNASIYGAELFEVQPSGNTGLISFTPTAADVGNHTMALLASDGELFGGRNVLFEVLEVNDRPVIEQIADQNATEDELWWVEVSASDEEGDPITLLNQTDLGTLQSVYTGPNTLNLSLTPTYSQRGDHTITIIAYETGNTSHNTTMNFTLTVLTNNRLPVIDTLTDPGATQGDSYTFRMNASDQDLGDTLNFTVTSDCPLPNPWAVTMISTNATNATAELQATLTNDHIACRDITIMVSDYQDGEARGNTTQNLTLNLINTNDAPVVNELSSDNRNLPVQGNASSLVAPTDLEFVYVVNVTDPDELTYEGELLVYTDDSPLFDIDAEGVIRFTPSVADIGIHLVNITATDDEGLAASRTINITVDLNRAPNLQSLPNATCQEDLTCIINLTAQDLDTGDNLTYTAALINASIASGTPADGDTPIIWRELNRSELTKAYNNSQVGNYTYNVTVTDRYGASDSGLLNLTVINTNDAPVYESMIPLPETIVETHPVLFTVDAADDDFINVPENLTLSASITGPNTNLMTPTKQTPTQWVVSFTPTAGDLGDYSVNFTVTDLAGANASQSFNFTVWSKSAPPVIEQVRPAFNSTSGSTTTGWMNTSVIGNVTNITFPEGATYTFNITYSDPDTALENMTITWMDEENTTLHQARGDEDYALIHTYDYFSSGQHAITVNVSDNRLETAQFTWNITVQEVNRPPQFLTNLPNRTVNYTTTIGGYLQSYLGQPVFYDPDDDLDSSGTIDPDETSTLTYSATTQEYLDITFDGPDVTLTPTRTGVVGIRYTARDASGAQAQSNNITYSVTYTPPETVPSTTSSSGGGGGGGSSMVPIPIRDDPEPITIEIVVPEPITVYYNETIKAPITITNPSDRVLRGVTLSAETAVENVSFSFSENRFEQLETNQMENVSLYVTNYRTQGTYEIKVVADVETPDVNDSAILYINSIEKGREGDSVQAKVTFANDLVAANPECVELNELIGQAQRAMETGQDAEADRLLNAVVDGCRYLVTESSRREELASGFDLAWIAQYRYTNVVLGGLLVALVGVAALLVWHYRSAAAAED